MASRACTWVRYSASNLLFPRSSESTSTIGPKIRIQQGKKGNLPLLAVTRGSSKYMDGVAMNNAINHDALADQGRLSITEQLCVYWIRHQENGHVR